MRDTVRFDYQLRHQWRLVLPWDRHGYGINLPPAELDAISKRLATMNVCLAILVSGAPATDGQRYSVLNTEGVSMHICH